MENSWHNISISLAGALQALEQVEQLAKTGYLKNDMFETAVKSLFIFNPESVKSVFGGLQNLQPGIQLLQTLIENHRDPQNASILRYLLGVLHLQRKLSKRRDMLDVIGKRLENAEQQATHFGITHDNVISNIEAIYTDTISKFQYRIQVTGEYAYLQQPRVASQIRVLLLAAIRAVTLWRQSGGSRWQFIFQRGKLLEATEALRV